MGKRKVISVENVEISITVINDEDYISLTDMTSNLPEGSKLIEKWLTNKNTIEYIGYWESLHNANFNSPEFGGIKNDAGTNRFYMSVKQWITRTNAIGILAKAGRYGGTFAHEDIAFHFGSYISPEFHLLLVKEYKRLKKIESDKDNLDWNVKRILSKTNYSLQTDAIKTHIIPNSDSEQWVYADEADLLNLALFGCTAKAWKAQNPERAKRGENIRDIASINELTILSNIQSLNALWIREGMDKKERFNNLIAEVAHQREVLSRNENAIKNIRKLSESTFVDEKGKKKK